MNNLIKTTSIYLVRPRRKIHRLDLSQDTFKGIFFI